MQPVIPRCISEILHDVVNVATQVTLTPASAFGHRERLEALRAEVAAAIARPAPDARTIDDRAAMLMTAAMHLAGSDWKDSDWLKLADCLLETIRKQWRSAIEQEMSVPK